MQFLFRTLINRHYQQVYSYAAHILGDACEAEDVTQEVYERLWKNMKKVDETSAKHWLMHVTRNRCIDRLRQRPSLQEANDSRELEPACTNINNLPDGKLANYQISRWLQTAISKLKEPYHSLIIGMEFQQKNVKTIAEQMNLSENQVKVYIHRARKQLRKLLQGVEL